MEGACVTRVTASTQRAAGRFESARICQGTPYPVRVLKRQGLGTTAVSYEGAAASFDKGGTLRFPAENKGF